MADRMTGDEERDTKGTILAIVVGIVIALLFILLLPPYPS